MSEQSSKSALDIQQLEEPNIIKENDASESLLQLREKELLEKISQFEIKMRKDDEIIKQLEEKLQNVTTEKDELKTKNEALQKEVTDINTTLAQNPKNGKNLLLEKTKICRNQELQIEALSQQIGSLKEIVAITKDLLDVRNIEVKQLEDKIDIMEQKFNVEKEKHSLLNQKLDTMVKLNSDLKKEYETQLSLFTQLRESYKQRENLNDTVQKLSDDIEKK
ncbi:filament-like plant protein 1 [Agrilus planipennis]|uniref:Filament-like plant protein 1 n=1 Tax=Agrilus planipennis TaxID=224129 RepID=A0A1W4WZX1_AGRPL|nr:filament-like plant protein 1 [Agrilus planipennis]